MLEPTLTSLPVAFAQGDAPSLLVQLVPFGVVFVIFYFLLIAPMRKRQKAHQAMLGALKKGDRVVTNGGLHGEVAGVHDDVVILKVADNVKVRVAKSAVSGMQGQEPTGGAR